jgi:hypothetical protein
MKHVVGQIAVTNLTNSTITIRANLIPGQSRAIKILPYKTLYVDRDIVVMAIAEFRKDKAKGVIWFDEGELFPEGITGVSVATGFGATGLQGETGLPGFGTTGLQGVTGISTVGPQGETGAQGATGLQGFGADLLRATLDDNQTMAAHPTLTFSKTVESIVLHYKAKLVSTGDLRTGVIYVANNGSLASIQDNYAETDDLGITWDAAVDSSSLYILYTTALKSSSRDMVSSIQVL